MHAGKVGRCASIISVPGRDRSVLKKRVFCMHRRLRNNRQTRGTYLPAVMSCLQFLWPWRRSGRLSLSPAKRQPRRSRRQKSPPPRTHRRVAQRMRKNPPHACAGPRRMSSAAPSRLIPTSSARFPGLKFDKPVYMIPEPGTDRIFVLQYPNGLVFAFQRQSESDRVEADPDVFRCGKTRCANAYRLFFTPTT